jgi:RimJ/RimL family protein N-acetyltransferase
MPHRYMLTITEQAKLLAWAAARSGFEGQAWPDDSRAVGCVDASTGKIAAVMVVNGFTADHAIVHFSTDGGKLWANSRRIIRGFMAYLFVALSLPQAVCMTPSDNTPMLKMLLQLGFSIEGRIRRSPDGSKQDIVTSMFAAECLWLKDEG